MTNILIITVKFIMYSVISINALIMVSGLYLFIQTVIIRSEKGSGQDGHNKIIIIISQ